MAQAPASPNALVGAWTMNKSLTTTTRGEAQPADRGRAGAGGGGRRGGGGRGGGFGGGAGGFGGPSVFGSRDADASALLRDALRDITDPSDHLTIVTTDTMVIITGTGGRTTRLSPDGRKVKDENTNIERRTRWDGDRLVSDVSGPGIGKVTETYSVDAQSHQLRLVAEMEGRNGGSPETYTHVYDPDAR
jgi:hypothetical protein